MDRRTIQLSIAGQSYRVVSSAGEGELQRLATTVNEKVASLVPRGRPAPPQAVLLAAMALAHDLETERARRQDLERRARDLLRRVLVKIDDALEGDPEEPAVEPTPVPPVLAIEALDEATPAE
jgi:cell division protein ZapA